MKSAVILASGAVLGLAVWGAATYVDPMVRVATAYKAKAFCSEVFVARRNVADVADVEFSGVSPVVDRVSANVDEERRRVDASVFGLGRVRVVFRDGYGCTIESGGDPEPLPELAAVEAAAWEEAPPVPGRKIERVDYGALEEVLNEAISSKAGGHRAIVVAVDGKIVAERYAPGFDEATPMLSWSVAKSVTATLVGAAAQRGYLDVDDPAPVPEWKNDPAYAGITWDDLLRMQSGLAFTETYGDPASDVSKMLFVAREAGAIAARQPAQFKPGEKWSYSSGTSNLIARTLRQALAERGIDFYAFANEALFGPLGAASFVIEPDSAGNPIGSSYVYATARDWARLGHLYLEEGVWNGERLLPEGWTDYVSKPTPNSDGEYGAHFWLNRDGAERRRFVPGLPESVFYMAGHEGKYVFIIPDRNAVIVSFSQTRGAVPIEVAGPLVSRLYAAIGAPQ